MDESDDVPFVIENAGGTAPAVIVVDHASNRFPARWGDLGLGPAEREAHIAWDPGALPVARHMARILDAPLVAGTISRLVLDPNRPAGSKTLAPAVSETTSIPGNAALTDADRADRIARVHTPYHAALGSVIERQVERAAAAAAGPVAVIAIHTFTPVYRGERRALNLGILFDRDDRLACGMLAALTDEPGIIARANEPYSPADEVYYTLERHALSRGLPNVMIEIRNDEVRSDEAQRLWAERLCRAMAHAMPSNGLPARTGAGT